MWTYHLSIKSHINGKHKAANPKYNINDITFTGTGIEVTITGYIEIIKSGTANQTLRFDVDKFLSIT